jgi:hypothetical protein
MRATSCSRHVVAATVAVVPPGPALAIPRQPAVAVVQHKRICQRGQPELYAEIRLPDLVGDMPVVEPAALIGVIGSTPTGQVKALQLATKLLYLDITGNLPRRKPGRRPPPPSSLCSRPCP